MKVHAVLLAAGVTCATTPSDACPVYLPAKDLPAAATGARRDFRLFALQVDAGGARRWQNLPFQVDPLDDQGVLLGEPDDGPRLADAALAPTDRLTLRREHFGAQITARDPAPCHADAAVELATSTLPLAYAYLVRCDDSPKVLPPAVTLDAKAHRIVAERYAYGYQPNNQLLFKEMLAKGPWGAPLLAGRNSDLAIHFDVRNFFTLDLTNKDVENYVNNTASGPAGLATSIDFFLRILFFKVDLKMSTTAGFYADSAHIPSVIDVPLDAAALLNPGSGILYSFERGAAAIDQSAPRSTMPDADPKRILAGWQTLATAGLPYCQGDACLFRLRGRLATERFGLDVNLPRALVERGFYPQWVNDVAGFKRQMGWDDDPQDPPAAVAVYFDNSGMQPGRYMLDQWIRVGKAESMTDACPQRVRLVGTVPFTALLKPAR